MGKRLGGRADYTIVLLDKKARRKRIPDQRAVLEIKEFVIVGGIWRFMQRFVEEVGVGGDVTSESDIVLGDIPCGELGNTGLVSIQ